MTGAATQQRAQRARFALALLALGLALAFGCADDADDGAIDAGGPGPVSDAGAREDGATADDDAGAQDAAPGQDAGDAICAACDGACEESLALEPAMHIDGPIDYADKPPAGGPHNPCWANYGPHLDQPLPAEEWVHNLEHGAVVFLYHCPAGCDAELEQLVTLALALPRTIVTEYLEMPAGFAAVSWGQRLVTSCFDMAALGAFYVAHIDQAPESLSSGRPGGC